MRKLFLFFVLLSMQKNSAQNGLCFTTSQDTLVGNYVVSSLTKADLNNDGKVDFITFWSNFSMYTLALSNNNGTYITNGYYTGDYVKSISTSDFNSDGNLDLAIGYSTNNTNNKIELLLGNGSGSFTSTYSHTVGLNPTNIVSEDFNNDGKKDIVICVGSDSLLIFKGNGNGNFQSPLSYIIGSGVQSLITGDFNNDGNIDLSISKSNSHSFFKGNGNGTFSFISSINSWFPKYAAVDFTNDNKLDLACIRGDSLYLYKGNGNFLFIYQSTHYAGAFIKDFDFADFNNDNKMDFVTANQISVDFKILLGNGLGGISATATYTLYPLNFFKWPFAVTAADVNNDGKKDVVIGYDNKYNLTIHLNCNTVDVGINENAFNDLNLNIYPNPATDQLNLTIENENNFEKIHIYNSIGQLIREEKITNSNKKFTVNTKDIPSGIYTLQSFSSNFETISKQFVISR